VAVGVLVASGEGEETLRKDGGEVVVDSGWVTDIGEELASGLGSAQLGVQFTQGAEVRDHR